MTNREAELLKASQGLIEVLLTSNDYDVQEIGKMIDLIAMQEPSIEGRLHTTLNLVESEFIVPTITRYNAGEIHLSGDVINALMLEITLMQLRAITNDSRI